MNRQFKDIPSYQESAVPADTISCIHTSWNSSHFALTSWNGEVRCYQVNSGNGVIRSQGVSSISLGAPATSCYWNTNNSQVFVGSGDGKVFLWNLDSGSANPQQIAQHQDGIVAMSINTKTNLLTVGSVDGDVGVYDIRSPNNVIHLNAKRNLTALCNGYCILSGSYYSRSVDTSQFAFTNGRDIFIYDLCNPSQAFKTYSVDDKDAFATSLAFSPTKYFAYGMMSGLVVVEFLNIPYNGTKNDTLRFRVGKQNNVQHTVSGICFHNPSQYIFTASGNGSLVLWDCVSRNRVQDFEKAQSNVTHGITACCCSYDGSLLVYAKGYGWDLGAPSTVPSSYPINQNVELFCKRLNSSVC